MTLLSDRAAAPTSINLDLPTPGTEDTALFTPMADIDSECDRNTSMADSLLPTVAAPAADLMSARSVLSPGFDTVPLNPLDAIVGADIDPSPRPLLVSTDNDLQTPRAPHLRLPSFELLGISNAAASRDFDPIRNPLGCAEPNSDGLISRAESTGSCGFSDLQSDGIQESPPCEVMAPRNPSRPSSQRLVEINPPRHYVTTITPPDESGRVFWQDMIQTYPPNTSTLSEDSVPSSEPTVPATASAKSASVSSTSIATVPVPNPQPRIKIHRTDSDQIASTTWLSDASNIIIKNLETAENLHGFIRVLSHALPCPSKKGFAFPVILNSLHDQTPGSPTCWINVFHALPGRYNLADLPTSPPATPGSPGSGEDYFTSKVFDSAIPILDYQNNITDTPKRAHPIVPPGTVHVSIVERYIPPSSSNEFAEMFDIKGHSLLVDRLIEISPDNGTLLFIYPTRDGAETFLKEYLAPVLDPLLRSMCVVNNLSVDLGSSLGKMDAVSKMLTFEALESQIEKLCLDLGGPGSSLDRLQDTPAKFTLELSIRSSIRLDRSVWAQDWWIKQEKPRVRDIVSKYFRMARHLPADSEIMPTSLIHEVLDGVAFRAGEQPTADIEVGVFVIKRPA